MFAVALCLLLEADALPPIEATDVYRFGVTSRQQTINDWQFIAAHLRWGRELQAAGTHRHINWFQWLEQAVDAHYCWYVLDDVGIAIDNKNRAAQISHLAKLRKILGPHDYYAGRMPSVQWFRWFQWEVDPPK